jgi:hypothetical protein
MTFETSQALQDSTNLLLVNRFSGHKYIHMNSNGTKVVADNGNGGILCRVTVNKAGASSNTLSIYNGLPSSGDLIAVIDTTVAGNKEYDVACDAGICAIMATGAAADVTIAYDV